MQRNKLSLDDQIFAILTQSISLGTRLCSNIIILPKLTHPEDSQVKQETKLTMPNPTDDIKVKEEPIESEEEQQQIDPSPSTIKPESPVLTTKSKEIKKIHRKFSFHLKFNKISSFLFLSSCFYM